MPRSLKQKEQQRLKQQRVKNKFEQRREAETRRCCSPLSCMACICLLLNVFVFSLTLMINQRVIHQKFEIQPGAIIDTTTTSPAEASASVNLQISKSSVSAKTEVQPNSSPQKKIHIVFVSDCKDPKQDWQAYMFFYHVMKSKQHEYADVTRIISGCAYEGRRQALAGKHKAFFEPMGKINGASKFHLHFSPAHPKQEAAGDLRTTMKYFNRPFALQHWMEHEMKYSQAALSASNAYDNTAVIVMDVDSILMRPFPKNLEFEYKEEIWKPRDKTGARVLQAGQPMAQHGGLYSTWWNDLNPAAISSVISPGVDALQKMARSDLEQKYAVGTPFLAMANDFYPLVSKWTEVTSPLYEALGDKITRDPNGAYTLAAVLLSKRHQMASSFSVHDFRSDEAFGLFKDFLHPGIANSVSTEELQKSKAPSESVHSICRRLPTRFKPHILNYNKRYAMGNFIIGKHYVDAQFLAGDQEATCHQPLYVEPSDDIAENHMEYFDPERHERVLLDKPQFAYQMTFMLCEVILGLNNASRYYKEKHCKDPNLEMTVQYSK